MPYVNCSKCGVRSFALAPWSTVDHCPTCETPLEVPRQSAGAEGGLPTRWPQRFPSEKDPRSSGTVEAR